MRFYAGIGSRKTPSDIGQLMTALATELEKRGFKLRSGGAEGADTFFELGVSAPSAKDIFVPWSGFNGRTDSVVSVSPEAYDLAQQFHPAWSRLSRGAKTLIARDCYQVLGIDLHTPAEFILCWTPGAQVTGGTGQALRMAEHFDIPVFNLGKDPAQVVQKLFAEI